MTLLQIEVGEALFSFTSKQHWVDNARESFERHKLNHRPYIAVDVLGRICAMGFDFVAAERDQSYPVTVYRYRPAAELAKQEKV